MLRKTIIFISLFLIILTPITATAEDKIEEKTFQHQITEIDLPEQRADFPESYTISEDGYYGSIPLMNIEYRFDFINTEDNRTVELIESIDHGVWPEPPIPENNIRIVYYDVDTDTRMNVTLPYQRMRVTKEASPVDWHTAKLTHHIVSGDYRLYGNIFLDASSEQPEFEGYEDNITSMLNLSKDKYTVVASKWTTSINDDIRIAEYTLAETVQRYESIYAMTLDLETIYKHAATATYEGTLQKEVAIDIEEIPSAAVVTIDDTQFPFAEAGTLTAATLLIVAIVYVIRKNVILYGVDKNGNKRRLGSRHVAKRNPIKISLEKYNNRLNQNENLLINLKKRLVRKAQGYSLSCTVGELTAETVIKTDDKFEVVLTATNQLERYSS